MADKTECIVDGFLFTSENDAELAKSELKKIAYLEEHFGSNNIQTVKALYEKAIEERYFQTPLGTEYMRKLRQKMIDGGVLEEDIKPLPLYSTFRHSSLSDTATVKKRTSKAKQEELNLKQKYRNACLIATIFGCLIIIMLFITFNGTTPNAINYKSAVLNQYSEWEEELKIREENVRARERELNISVDK